MGKVGYFSCLFGLKTVLDGVVKMYYIKFDSDDKQLLLKIMILLELS